MDFTAIDFETANQRRDSACQLAAVVVQGGQIVDRQMWMIRPRPFYFSPRNIEVHGIRPENVAREPEFGELWAMMSPFLQANCLVAHNASFDIGVLTSCVQSHKKVLPDLQFTCTRLIARAAWPGRPGYGLKAVANWLGIQFRHHDALEDSVACARILLAAAATIGETSLPQLENKLKLTRGVVNQDGYQGAKKLTRLRREKPSLSSATFASASESLTVRCNEPDYVTTRPLVDMQRLLIRADFLRRLDGKQVVITGRFKALSRENAELLAIRLGASIQSAVTPSTNILVVGELDDLAVVDPTVVAGRSLSFKEQAARLLESQGHPIRLMNEADFIGLIQHIET